ncbi:MAG: hypothetical protein M3Q96_06350, partial [Pseudomonadota bacterium]|nr:hypothetical protein [Pseudomonadota bacterium]
MQTPRTTSRLSLLVAAIVIAFSAACDRNAAQPDASAAQEPVVQEPAPMPNDSSPDANMPPKADAQMQAVLDQVTQLGGKPIETLTPAEARQQPTSADAVTALLKAQGKPTPPEAVGTVTNSTSPRPGGAVPIRIYMPASAAPLNAGKGPLPVVLYIHG